MCLPELKTESRETKTREQLFWSLTRRPPNELDDTQAGQIGLIFRRKPHGVHCPRQTRRGVLQPRHLRLPSNEGGTR